MPAGYLKVSNSPFKMIVHIEKSNVKKHQKTFDLDAEAWYGYGMLDEDIEL